MKESFTRLLNKITDTRNARLEAYKRNNKLQALSTYSLSGISALTIASSLYLAVVPTDELKDFVGLIGSIASLFILIISLVDSSKDYSLKAYLYHKCALELSPLALKLEKNINLNNYQESLYDEIEEEYNRVLNNYSLNHKEEDYLLYKLKYKEKFYDKRSDCFIWIRKVIIDVSQYFLYYFMLITILISTVFLVSRMYNNIDKKYSTGSNTVKVDEKKEDN
jgi:hypothetical protein